MISTYRIFEGTIGKAAAIGAGIGGLAYGTLGYKTAKDMIADPDNPKWDKAMGDNPEKIKKLRGFRQFAKDVKELPKPQQDKTVSTFKRQVASGAALGGGIMGGAGGGAVGLAVKKLKDRQRQVNQPAAQTV